VHTLLADTETPLIVKILEIDADTVQSSSGTVVRRLHITAIAPERHDSPGGGRYFINIAEDAAKELAGRITNFFERERK
jgi:hypothetical protein